MEFCLPVTEAALFDSCPHFFHNDLVKMQVVDGVELGAQNFTCFVQVVEIGAAEVAAGVAAATFVQRAGIQLVFGIFQF